MSECEVSHEYELSLLKNVLRTFSRLEVSSSKTVWVYYRL